MQYITDRDIDRIAGDTGAKLKAEKRVSIVVADSTGAGIPWEGGINGYFFRIKRETPVSVPESIARLIAQSAEVCELSARQLKAYKTISGKKLN